MTTNKPNEVPGTKVNGSNSDSEDMKTFSLDELKQLANGDEDFVNEMITMYIANAKDIEAKMRSTLKSESWEALADHAHSMSPPSRHIGALAIYRLLSSIEETARNNPDRSKLEEMISELETKFGELIPQLESELKERNGNNS